MLKPQGRRQGRRRAKALPQRQAGRRAPTTAGGANCNHARVALLRAGSGRPSRTAVVSLRTGWDAPRSATSACDVMSADEDPATPRISFRKAFVSASMRDTRSAASAAAAAASASMRASAAAAAAAASAFRVHRDAAAHSQGAIRQAGARVRRRRTPRLRPLGQPQRPAQPPRAARRTFRRARGASTRVVLSPRRRTRQPGSRDFPSRPEAYDDQLALPRGVGRASAGTRFGHHFKLFGTQKRCVSR